MQIINPFTTRWFTMGDFLEVSHGHNFCHFTSKSIISRYSVDRLGWLAALNRSLAAAVEALGNIMFLFLFFQWHEKTENEAVWFRHLRNVHTKMLILYWINMRNPSSVRKKRFYMRFFQYTELLRIAYRKIYWTC